MRKAFNFRILIIALATGLIPMASYGFALSENEAFKAEIRNAVARAKDFKRVQEKRKREEAQAEKFADQARSEREKIEQIRERDRARYVEWRARQPDESTEEARREKINLERVAKEEAKMEANRKRYVEKRETVRRTLEKEGHINETLEYGLQFNRENLVKSQGATGSTTTDSTVTD